MKFSHLTRVYTNQSIFKNQTLTIENEHFHYLKSVMRLRKNDIFRIFNQSDGEFIAKIQEINKSSIVILIDEQLKNVKSEQDLILAICIIKYDRMVEAIKAAIQLGATKIIPIISDRTQLKKISIEKINKVILQSTEQSERLIPAILTNEMSLEQFLHLDDIEQIIAALENEDENNKINQLDQIKKIPAILIGPEGGFTDKEINMLKSYDHVCCISLGSTVLRSETAAIASIACVQMCR